MNENWNDLESRLASWTPRRPSSKLKEKLFRMQTALGVTTSHLKQKKVKLDALASHLRAIDPRNLLTKGYCILFEEKNNSIILNAQNIKQNDRLRILAHGGKITATVNEVL